MPGILKLVIDLDFTARLTTDLLVIYKGTARLARIMLPA